MNNERGIAAVILLALMPLLIAAGTLVAVGFLLLRVDGKTRHICRNESLAAQEIAADRLNQLLALNPQAQKLRLQREIAEDEVAITVPPAKAVAEAKLALIVAQQLIFGAKQNILYTEGKHASSLRPHTIGSLIQNELYTAQILHGDTSSRLAFHTNIRLGSFDLERKPADSLTPDFNPSSSFAKNQLMVIKWQFELKAIIPKWTAAALPGRYSFSGICSANLASNSPSLSVSTKDRRDNQWQAVLTPNSEIKARL
jgi:hypothetical protein